MGSKVAMRDGWTRVRFGDIAEQLNERVDDPNTAGVDRYVGLEHLDPGSLRVTRWGSPGEVSAQKLRFHPGDIIFGKRRAYQRKVAVADFGGICSAHAMVLRERPEVLARGFLIHFMASDGFMERAVQISVGSLSPTINWSTLRDQEFDLPPIEEQRRIVLVCAAAAHCIEATNQLHTELRVTLSALGNRYAEMLADTPQLTVYEICDPNRPLCYGVVQPGDPDGQVPLLRVCDLTDEGTIADRASLNTITKEVDEQYRRSRVDVGDVLVSIVGTIGRVAVVEDEHVGSNIARALARISPIRAVMTPEFLAMVFRSPDFQTRLVRGAFESARKTLNLSELGQMRVPCPKLSVQREITQTNAMVRDAFFATTKRAAATHESIRRFLLPGEATLA